MEEGLITELFEEAKRSMRLSTCNIRQTGAVLLLQNGSIYGAANGSSVDSCKSKGKDYCQRDNSVDGLEYLTCPSLCAEGSAVITAMNDHGEDAIKESIFISTDFPCDRCKNLIIDYKVGKLYFGGFKENEPRLRDLFFAAQMSAYGVSVNQISESAVTGGKGIKYIIRGHKPDPQLERRAMMSMRNKGQHYVRLILDEGFRKQYSDHLSNLKRMGPTSQPESCRLTAKPLL